MESNWLIFGGRVLKIRQRLIGGPQAILQTDIGELIGISAMDVNVAEDDLLFVRKGAYVESVGEDEI